MGKRGPKPKPPKQCSVDGCALPVNAKGLCNSHYARFRRHGQVTGGGTSWGEPLRYLKEVVLKYDGNDCIKWPYSTGTFGYGNIRIDGETKIVPRIVCEEYNGSPPTAKHEAAHSCGNGHLGCVTPNHLSWKTRTQNQHDRWGHGTSNRGESHALSKLSETDVIDIRRRAEDGEKDRDLAERFSVARETITAIRNRKTWEWLDAA